VPSRRALRCPAVAPLVDAILCAAPASAGVQRRPAARPRTSRQPSARPRPARSAVNVAPPTHPSCWPAVRLVGDRGDSGSGQVTPFVDHDGCRRELRAGRDVSSWQHPSGLPLTGPGAASGIARRGQSHRGCLLPEPVCPVRPGGSQGSGLSVVGVRIRYPKRERQQ